MTASMSPAADDQSVSAAWSGLLLGGLPDTTLHEEIEPGLVHRRAAALPAPRPQLVAIPRAPRPRRLPRRRHGPRQDGDHARPPRRPTGPTPRRLSALGRAQLGDRGRSLHADDDRHRAPRRPAPRRQRRRPAASRRPCWRPAISSSPPTAWSPATSMSSPRSTGRRSCSTRRSSSRTRRPAPPAPCASCAAGQRIALTGTPVENRLSELWAILDWVNPGMLGSREKFRHRYSKPIERGDDGAVAAEAAAALRALTRPFVLRRSKADRQLVPELPDKIEQIAWAGLTREQAVLYQKVVDELLEEANQHEGMKRRVDRPRRPHQAQADLQPPGPRPRRRLPPARPLGQADPVRRARRRTGRRRRAGARVHPVRRDGRPAAPARRRAIRVGRCRSCAASTSKTGRDRVVAEFQAGAGPPLLLVSLKAGGTGLNLTAASQVIHYDRWWNPAVENQATDRAWRIGQGQTVLVHKLVCEGTVEERIAKTDRRQAGARRSRRRPRRSVAVRVVDVRAARARPPRRRRRWPGAVTP